MQTLNAYISEYTPHAIAAAVTLAFLLFLWILLRIRRKRKAHAPKRLADALPKEHGMAYKFGKGVWFCIAGIFHGLLFLLKLIVPNMVLLERLLALAGMALIAYPFFFPPMRYYLIGAGVLSLMLAIIAHAYNDEMRRNSPDKKPY
ncbi:MAG: hypothetical protein J6I40_04660 [Mailhella sp.]|nr:hypothetical protein [Mailhella sp.]